ncbi:MAG: hypothetical protein H7Y11_01480, partial [Armatimonadetes bacterium]|nr:hypothetical protein [Anaerolineae bacterium]
ANPDAASYGLVILKASNNPLNRELGIVFEISALTPNTDADGLVCSTTVCTFTLSAELKALLSTGTYAWTALAASPGGQESEATNAAFMFSVNPGDLALLLNGGFELDAEADKIPDGWLGKNLTGDKRKCNKPGKVIAYEGECAFEFKGVAGEASKLQQKLTIDGLGLVNGDVLVITSYTQGKEALADVGSITLKVKYVNTTLPADKLKQTLAGGTYAYDESSGELTVDGEVDSVKVTLGYTGITGKLQIDGMSVTLKGNSTRLGILTSAGDSGLIPLPAPVQPGLLPQR